METPTNSSSNPKEQSSPIKKRRFIDLFRMTSHDQNFEKQKKQALYNLIAFSAFLFLIITVICCYFILGIFLLNFFTKYFY